MMQIRKFDDKIINILNDEIPTESFYSKSVNPTIICNELKNEVPNKSNYDNHSAGNDLKMALFN